jgi:SOS-response transcriptional repressor LexA
VCEILDFHARTWEKNNVSPSYREIGAGVGLRSVSSVNRYIRSLTNKGRFFLHDGEEALLVLKRTS